ncbi:MAG: Crp/Fnr family transcriptional regulator [Hydrogeniiclostridium mannosilyticum]
MNYYLEDLARTNLFSGIEPEEIAGLLDCLRAGCVSYSSGEMIIEEGSRVHKIGVMLSGHARSIKWDASDRVIILTMLGKGSEIGVLLAAQPERESPVSVQAQDDISVLMIPYDRTLAPCVKACSKHSRLLRNYISVVAEKGLVLHERINCLLKPTVRGKILAYLRQVSRDQKSNSFQVPFNRNGMSEYLNIERSALSRELSSMKRDGLIDYHRNEFRLL